MSFVTGENYKCRYTFRLAFAGAGWLTIIIRITHRRRAAAAAARRMSRRGSRQRSKHNRL